MNNPDRPYLNFIFSKIKSAAMVEKPKASDLVPLDTAKSYLQDLIGAIHSNRAGRITAMGKSVGLDAADIPISILHPYKTDVVAGLLGGLLGLTALGKAIKPLGSLLPKSVANLPLIKPIYDRVIDPQTLLGKFVAPFARRGLGIAAGGGGGVYVKRLAAHEDMRDIEDLFDRKPIVKTIFDDSNKSQFKNFLTPYGGVWHKGESDMARLLGDRGTGKLPGYNALYYASALPLIGHPIKGILGESEGYAAARANKQDFKTNLNAALAGLTKAGSTLDSVLSSLAEKAKRLKEDLSHSADNIIYDVKNKIQDTNRDLPHNAENLVYDAKRKVEDVKETLKPENRKNLIDSATRKIEEIKNLPEQAKILTKDLLPQAKNINNVKDIDKLLDTLSRNVNSLYGPSMTAEGKTLITNKINKLKDVIDTATDRPVDPSSVALKGLIGGAAGTSLGALATSDIPYETAANKSKRLKRNALLGLLGGAGLGAMSEIKI